MKRSTKLVVGITIAAITFASLMAFTGGKHHFRHYGYHQSGYGKAHDCSDREDANKDKLESKKESKPVEVDSTKADRQ
jgi:hypothetical protein